MGKKRIIKDTAEVVVKNLPDTTKSVDKLFSSIVDIFDLLITPFQLLKIYKEEKMEEFKKNLKAKINNIPDDSKKDQVDLNIVGPTLDALKYAFMEDDLREMFENLLASSIDKREDVFPSFVDIVRQLSSDEAKLLKYLSLHGKDYPLVDLQYVLNDNNGYHVIMSNFTNLGYGILEKPELISAYLNDLNRFGLITIQDDVYLSRNELYTNIENSEVIQKQMKKVLPRPGKYEVKKKKFVVTDYGQSFISSCVNKKVN